MDDGDGGTVRGDGGGGEGRAVNSGEGRASIENVLTNKWRHPGTCARVSLARTKAGASTIESRKHFFFPVPIYMPVDLNLRIIKLDRFRVANVRDLNRTEN